MSKKARPRIYNRAGQRVPVQDKTWYALQASGDAAERVIEVFVYGEIGGWGLPPISSCKTCAPWMTASHR